MKVYAIIPLEESPHLDAIIQSIDESAYVHYSPRLYLVSYAGTSGDLAEAVGFRKDRDKGSTGIVLKINYYNGLANPDMWEWLSSRQNDT